VTSFAQVKPRTKSRQRSAFTLRARLPTTIASSPSKSTRSDCGGRTMVALGLSSALGGLRKMIGSEGGSLPSSLAWSA
jgi:hypothetical protein